MTEKPRILFVHIPQERQGRFFINQIAVGTFALADRLASLGFTTEIVHLLVEKLVNKDFDLGQTIINRSFNVVCRPLHWHYQAHDVMETARRIKAACPGVRMITGGYTASFFADEIMQQHSEIDYVVCGEADTFSAVSTFITTAPTTNGIPPGGITRPRTSYTRMNSSPDGYASAKGQISILAASLGLMIGIETHGSFTGIGEECVAVMQRLNHPNVGINYDPANLIYYRGVRPEDDIAVVAPYVVHLHAKDKSSMALETFDFPAIGDGIIDWVEVSLGTDYLHYDLRVIRTRMANRTGMRPPSTPTPNPWTLPLTSAMNTDTTFAMRVLSWSPWSPPLAG